MHPFRWLSTLPLRLRSLFRNKEVERELDDEIRYHLDRQSEEFIAKGMSPGDARYAALRAFDGPAQQQEKCRDARRVGYLEDLMKDLLYAARQLRRTPALTTVVVLSLALGIGANVAIFSVIDAVMLRPLPLERPQDLVMLGWAASQYPETLAPHREGGGRYLPGATVRSFSYPDFETLRNRNPVLSSTFAVSGNDQPVNIEIHGSADGATMQGVSGNYFQGLGVQASMGRVLVPSDDRKDAQPAAVISYGFWMNKLGGDSSVVGQTLSLNAAPVTITGITQKEFSGLDPSASPDIWIPLSLYMAQAGYAPANISVDGPLTSPLPYWENPQTWWLQIFGRLKPGISEAKARSELSGLFDQSIRPRIESGTNPTPAAKIPELRVVPAGNGIQELRNYYATPLFLMLGAVSIVLLIACGNVAALLLARATIRSKEIALRLSLGAGRFRLIRQLLTESVLLAVLGGAAGLLVAQGIESTLVTLLSGNALPINSAIALNWHVLAFAAGLSVLTGLTFGLAPALRATRTELVTAIKQSTAVRKRFGSAKWIVGTQVALCLALVTSAGLFLRTLQNLHRIDTGFDSQHLLLFTVAPGLNGYAGDRLANYYEELRTHLESIPGITLATLANRSPLGQGSGSSSVYIPGYTSAEDPPGIARHQVGPKYFETLAIPITIGRGIETQDVRDGHRVIVVNEKLVQEYFHGHNPLGTEVQLGDSNGPAFEIVGVARDVKYNRLQDEAPSIIYYPYTQFMNLPSVMTIIVRSPMDTASLSASIRNAAAELDRNIPVRGIRTETEIIDRTFSLERAFAMFTTSFGLLALLLSCIGLYGTMAYSITQRTREIGIRMALGARRGDVLGAVLRETLLVVSGGLVAGVLLTMIIAPVLKSRLFGLAPHDPMTTLFAAIIIGGISALAGYIPARRASKIDPMIALRHE